MRFHLIINQVYVQREAQLCSLAEILIRICFLLVYFVFIYLLTVLHCFIVAFGLWTCLYCSFIQSASLLDRVVSHFRAIVSISRKREIYVIIFTVVPDGAEIGKGGKYKYGFALNVPLKVL